MTASWVAQAADAGQPIQLQVVATNFLEGPGSTDQWQVPAFGFTDATLTNTVTAWKSNTDGPWNSTENWSVRAWPGFSGVSNDQASFNGAAGLNVDLGNSSPSIAGLTFGPSALNYDVKSTGSGQLQLNSGSSNATIMVSAGSQTIDAPVVLENNVNVTVAGGTSLTISGGIGQSGGSQALTLTGSGSLTLSGSDNYIGGTTVDGGTLILSSSNALSERHGPDGRRRGDLRIGKQPRGREPRVPTYGHDANHSGSFFANLRELHHVGVAVHAYPKRRGCSRLAGRGDAPAVAIPADMTSAAGNAVFASHRTAFAQKTISPADVAQSARPWAWPAAIERFWNSSDQDQTTESKAAALDKVLARFGV